MAASWRHFSEAASGGSSATHSAAAPPPRGSRGGPEPVSDPVEWVAAYRALIASFGLIGGAIVGDVRGLDDEALLARDRALPVVRITPTDGSGPLVAGAFDPGGSGWLLPCGASLILVVLAWARFGPLRRRRERRRATPRRLSAR